MKKCKLILRTVTLAIAICLCTVFCGCTDLFMVSNKIEGTYKFKSMSYMEDGVKIELEAGEKFMGAITLTEDYMKITLNEDNSASIVYAAAPEEILKGTWEKESESKIKLTFEGDSLTVTYQSNTLIMEEDGATIILEK